MAQVVKRRAVVEHLIKRTQEEAAAKRKSIETIDPVIRVGRRIYPYLSDRELNEFASTALRMILSSKETEIYQMTLVSY
jgi:hypothetical protein